MFTGYLPPAEFSCARSGVWHQTQMSETTRCCRSFQSGLGGKCEDSSRSRNIFRCLKNGSDGSSQESDERLCDKLECSGRAYNTTVASCFQIFTPLMHSLYGGQGHHKDLTTCRLPVTPKNQLGGRLPLLATHPPDSRSSCPISSPSFRLFFFPHHSLCLEGFQSSLEDQILHPFLCKTSLAPSESFPNLYGPWHIPLVPCCSVN